MTRRFLFAVAVLCVCAASTPASDGGLSKALTARTRAYLKLDAATRGASRQGVVFTVDVANDFRKIIRKAFDGKDGRNMRRTIRETEPVRQVTLHVNDPYPEDIPMTTMPPTLLGRLPDPPKELVYRIIGRALVLLDIRTNVIVDFIPDAIPKVH
jgi:hypothetical protein